MSVAALAVACGPGKPAATEPASPSPAAGGGAPGAAPESEAPAGPARPVTRKTLAEVGLEPGALDRTADPCDDFYRFSCGNWIDKTEIAADKPLAMRSFVDIEDRNQAYLHGVLDRAAAEPGQDPVLVKVGAFYGSCMDEAAVEKAGMKPIAPLLAETRKVKDAKTLTAAIASLQQSGINALFVFGPTQDAGDATRVIGNIDQGGIGLPDRDYYLKSDEQTEKIRGAYRAYVQSLLEEVGHKPDAAAAEAADIIALETEIAKVSKDKVARRDPRGTYNKIDREGVAKAMTHFAWDAYWKAIGLAEIKDITVTSPEFLAGVDKLIESTKPETWRAFLAFHTVNRAAPILTRKLQESQFKFLQSLTGQPGESKQAAETQVHAISAAMKQNLATLPWMDPATRTRASEKLDKVFYQIGYPNKWKTYPFKVGRKTFAMNILAARRAERHRRLDKIGKPVDKDDWQLSPPTVNAYYDPQLNGMVFPAGILQPPFYDVRSSIPVNLGAMGIVVGHELTHGFDDQGAQYDAVGNLASWWEESTNKRFKAKTQCVIDQYGKYEQAGLKLNGANTVGENIADIGGVKLALAAYRALRASAPDAVVADGFSEDQQFFLAFAQAWCAKARPDFDRLLVNVDVHSPPRWRVNGALQDTPDFARAFSCKPSAKMVPKNTCVVW